jgi:hypothetical protein
MITTLSVLALVAGLDLGVPVNPKWQADYSQALSRAAEDRKPMAVFIGHGADSLKHMVADGALSADAAKLLATSYVCLYLDADTPTGKDLASRFEMTEGLVISSAGGSVQAYRYAGKVPGTTLTRELTHYATAGQPTTTISAGAEAMRQAASTGYVIVAGGCANGNCQMIVPASAQYAAPGTVSYPFSSSCPTGRCPNQR